VRVSLATIYNTLHQFTQAGLLREIVVDAGRSYFDTNISDHHHFFHERTGMLADIPGSDVVVAQLPPAPGLVRLPMIIGSLKTLLRWVFALIGMVAMLFEEVLWSRLGDLMAWIGRFTPIAKVEEWISRLPPILALPFFLLPWLIMLPVKLGALWLIALGHFLKGALLFVFGEAFGVAFLARLYELCRPALHSWTWFVVAERILIRWTHWAHKVWAEIPAVKNTHAWWHRCWQETRRRFDDFLKKAREPRL
jgi:hypothetical protein